MSASDFRRLALSLTGAAESSHRGAADSRAGGRIFATPAVERQGYGYPMLALEQQAGFVAGQPDVFLPVSGGWGRMRATHIRLAAANEDLLAGALRTGRHVRIRRRRIAHDRAASPATPAFGRPGKSRRLTHPSRFAAAFRRCDECFTGLVSCDQRPSRYVRA